MLPGVVTTPGIRILGHLPGMVTAGPDAMIF
jgi:hypothetical protein